MKNRANLNSLKLSNSEKIRWRTKLKEKCKHLHQRGCKKLTILFIPHTEKRILSWHLSLYSIFFIGLSLVFIMLISIMSLVGKSGEDIQFYDMGLGNSEFSSQSLHITEEFIQLHHLINKYTQVISDLFINLEGNKNNNFSDQEKKKALAQSEIEKLKNKLIECRTSNKKCQSQEVKDILKHTIYLSHQDNQNLEHTINLTLEILKILNTSKNKNLFKHTPSIWPTRGYLLAPYGKQIDPQTGKEIFKRGIEIGAFHSTEVLATAPGEIIKVAYDKNYGLYLEIQHAYGIATFYAHLDRTRVKIGDKVEKGEVIAYVGNTGLTTLHSLYYEVHVGTVAYNPYAFINHLQNLWLVPPKT